MQDHFVPLPMLEVLSLTPIPPRFKSPCTLHGQVVFCLMDSSTNLWTMTSVLGRGDTNAIYHAGGSKSLAGTLSKVSVKWSGSNTSDAGSINVMYE